MSEHKDKERRAWNGEIGPFLEEAREELGLSLKEAERSTRIRCKYLEGLEREDPDELPDKGYLQGFLRSYADFLGLDAEEFGSRLKKYDGFGKRRRQRWNYSQGGSGDVSSNEASLSSSLDKRRARRGRVLIILSIAGLALALISAALYVLWDDSPLSNSPSDRPQAPSGDAGGSPNESPQEGPTPTLNNGSRDSGDGKPEAEESMQAEISVRGTESWISVETESGVQYTEIAQPGFSRTFKSGGELRITTGNAGAVELRINGIDYGRLGENGEVTSKSFTLKSAR